MREKDFWHDNLVYRYAYALAMDERYRGKAWSEVEPEVRRYWENEYERLGAWGEFKESVRQARRELEEADDPYDVYRDRYRRRHQAYYGNGNGDYTAYEPAYRYGYTLANDDRYRGRTWAEIEAEARRQWDEDHQDQGLWEDFKDAVRHAWNSITGQDDDYEAVHEKFHRHYEENYADMDRPYLDYDPAYRYGYRLVVERRYPGRDWASIEPEVREYWETEYRHTRPWDEYKEAVRYGYDAMQVRMGV